MRKIISALILASLVVLLGGCDYLDTLSPENQDIINDIIDEYELDISNDDVIVEVFTESIDLKTEIEFTSEVNLDEIYDSLEFDYTLLNLDVLGDYEIPFTYTDLEGELQSDTIIVRVVDTTPPVISLNGELEITHTLGNFYMDEEIIATDNYDTTVEISIESNYNPFKKGQYSILYQVTDTSGNFSEITRTVNVGEVVNETNDNGVILFDNMEYIKKIIELDNGDLIILGAGNSNGKIFRTNNIGVVYWEKTITQNAYADVVIEDGIINSAGELVIVGWKNFTESNPDGAGRAGFITKYDLSGNKITYQEETPSEMINYQGVIQLADGNYAVVASENFGVLSVTKMNSSFEQIWKYEYSGEKWYQQIMENDSGLIEIYVNQAWGSSLSVIVLNSNGTEQSVQHFSASQSIRYILILDDAFLIASEGRINVVTSDGNVQHDILIDGNNVQIHGISQLANGNFIIVGEFDSDTNSREAVVLELNSLFEIVNTITLEGSDQDAMINLLITSDKIICGGFTNSINGDYSKKTETWTSGFLYMLPLSISEYSENDIAGPIIEMIGESAINIQLGTTYTEPGISATDNGLDVPVIVTSNVDTSQTGLYYIYYQAEDVEGNLSLLRRTVNVYDTLTEENEYMIDLFSLSSESEDIIDIFASFDNDNNNYLTRDEFTSATSLTLSNVDILDLKYINLLTNLEYLSMYNCSVEDITGIKDLTKLTYLSINNCNISNISELVYLTDLVELYLPNNEIIDVTSISTLTKLEKLDISMNNITSLDTLGSLPNLIHLYAGRLPATEFNNVSRFPELEYLDVSWGSLNSISGFNNPKLAFLDFYDAEFTNLDGFTGLVNSPLLTEIRAGQNGLTDVCGIKDVVSIQQLLIETNNISDISCLDKLVNVTTIQIINNAVSDITVLANMTKLVEVNLGAGDYDLSVLTSLPDLQKLYIHMPALDVPLDSNNRIVLETLIDNGVFVHGGNIIDFGSISGALASILEVFDLDNSNGIDLHESRNILDLDLSSIQIYSLNSINELASLQTLSINITNMDVSVGSYNRDIIEQLQANNVIVTEIDDN